VVRSIPPIAASWLPGRAVHPKPKVPSWLAPRAAVSAQPAPLSAPSAPPAVLSVLPDVTPLRIVESSDEAPVIIPKPSPLPEDLLADDGLREENAALAARLDEATRALESLRAQALRDGESELVRLALAVAERVVGRELTTDPALVAGWAREALEALLTREGLVVTVSPDVAAAVAPAAWERALAAPYTLVVDAALPPHACSARAGAATVDAGLGARLAAMRDALAEGEP
jgi:hypothetical protein